MVIQDIGFHLSKFSIAKVAYNYLAYIYENYAKGQIQAVRQGNYSIFYFYTKLNLSCDQLAPRELIELQADMVFLKYREKKKV